MVKNAIKGHTPKREFELLEVAESKRQFKRRVIAIRDGGMATIDHGK
jgi:hypothetical protein